jgi:drug/metabolite transporter (DMT)-like permease
MKRLLEKRNFAIAALLLVTVIWGATFVWMKEALDTANTHLGSEAITATIGLFVAFRFGLAAALLPIVVPASRRGWNDRKVWRDGMILAGFLLGGFLLQMVGLDEVTPPVSAFLTSLYVVFTALIWTVWKRRPPNVLLILGVVLATFGAGWISGPPQVEFGFGEWVTVACAVLFAGHIVATDVITKRVSPMAVTFTTFFCVAVGSSLVFLLALAIRPALLQADWSGLMADRGFWQPLLLTSVLGSGVALTLLNQFQRVLSPVRAAILYALEPVWAAIFAVWLNMATLEYWLLVGGLALLAGNLIVEIGPRTGMVDGKPAKRVATPEDGIATKRAPWAVLVATPKRFVLGRVQPWWRWTGMWQSRGASNFALFSAPTLGVGVWLLMRSTPSNAAAPLTVEMGAPAVVTISGNALSPDLLLALGLLVLWLIGFLVSATKPRRWEARPGELVIEGRRYAVDEIDALACGKVHWKPSHGDGGSPRAKRSLDCVLFLRNGSVRRLQTFYRGPDKAGAAFRKLAKVSGCKYRKLKAR